jgi:hypothetical protein
VEHLLGQALAHFVLEPPALLEEFGDALGPVAGQEPRLVQEHAQRRGGRPARALDHVRDAEVEPARALTPRRRHQPQRAAIEARSAARRAARQTRARC